MDTGRLGALGMHAGCPHTPSHLFTKMWSHSSSMQDRTISSLVSGACMEVTAQQVVGGGSACRWRQ